MVPASVPALKSRPLQSQTPTAALFAVRRVAREPEVEGRALPEVALHPDASAMAFHQVAREPQAETRALDPGHVVAFHAEELAEHPRQLLGGDPHALVLHGDQDAIVELLRVEDDASAVRGVLDGIPEQVV